MPATRATIRARDTAAEVAFLTRALKAPTLRESVPRLAERARAESWTHEEFLVACLHREVSAREFHGGQSGIRAARFPARKASRSSTLTTPAASNATPSPTSAPWTSWRHARTWYSSTRSGTGKTHLATGLAIRACQAGHRVLFAPHPSG
jgi:DNA replication protein DnaC